LISNDSAGYTQLLDWIFAHAPGPRLVVCIEGTRSYGAGLARAAAAAGLRVIDREQLTRKARRGKGKSDPIRFLCDHRLGPDGPPALLADHLVRQRCHSAVTDRTGLLSGKPRSGG
jgi:hypothetical protein